MGKVESSDSGVGTGRMALGTSTRTQVRVLAPLCSISCTGKAEMGGSLGHGEQPASLNQEVSGSGRDGLKE